MAGAGIDPFTMGLLMTALANNPQLGQQIGIDPTQALGGPPMGLGMGPGMQQLQQGQQQGSPNSAIATAEPVTPTLANLSGMGGPANAGIGGEAAREAMQTVPASGSAGAMKLGGPAQAAAYNPGMQGVKAPAPITPIMNGGVTGGVRAPEVTAKMGQGSAAIAALMAALLGGQVPERVGTLGSYVRPPGR